MAKVTVLSSFLFPQGKVLLSLTIIASSLFVVSETNLCTNCTASQVCCFDVCVEGPNCLGQFCHYDEHCSEGEICCSSKCVDRSNTVGCPCQNDGQCSTSQHCCNFTCVNASNCLGKKCENTTECPQGQICCANTCVRGPSCVGLSCNIGYPKCSNGESCCNNKCVKGWSCLGQSCKKNSDCGPAVVIVSNIFRHRRQRIQRARQTRVLTNNEAQAQVYQNYQAPPPYQPEDSCYPPPEYEQHQSEMSASYNPAMIREDEPPPPYSAEQKGESGGQVRLSEAS
ncbi:unnamed protein product [Porites evermanni]|uniref:Uncharacterized protein n=1 Tax=Porites evermanni TaxID=104178 RepID=A0ABN8SIR3_9CNID|nr:unnamed protein product [Porites evermanni]